MHEMGIALQVIDIALRSIPEDLSRRPVSAIRLKVGKLAAVVPASLRFCFEVAAKETPLKNAALVIEEIPVTLRCNDCKSEQTVETPVFICNRCGGGSIQIISGQELDIDSIEIADEDPPALSPSS
jgi:hydrogenase nickel incorporation protein HypA/HybF